MTGSNVDGFDVTFPATGTPSHSDLTTPSLSPRPQSGNHDRSTQEGVERTVLAAVRELLDRHRNCQMKLSRAIDLSSGTEPPRGASGGTQALRGAKTLLH
jgi:hypothetical protein